MERLEGMIGKLLDKPGAPRAQTWQDTKDADSQVARLAPIDRKNVERPFKYTGDIKKFIVWYEKFVGFLQAQDTRWKGLLETIESWGPKELMLEDTVEVATQAGV